MTVSIEMLWNRICTIGDEVHDNALKTVKIETKLNNHLEHQKTETDKKLHRTDKKFIILGIIVTASVGLLAIFK